MSLTFIAWFCLLLFLFLRGLTSPAWMFCAYFQTLFASPGFWWWGKMSTGIATFPWNFCAALCVVASILLNQKSSNEEQLAVSSGNFLRDRGIMQLLLLLGCLNVAFVHFFLADVPETSWFFASLFWKQCVLLLLFYGSIKELDDLVLILKAIFWGCGYIAFEIVIREQGYFEKGRLEGIGIPGAGDSNLIAGVLLLGLLIGGYFFLVTKPIGMRLTYGVFSGVILHSILRCNSRGAFLALIVSGAFFLIFATGKARKQAISLGAIGALAILLSANQSVWDRFSTIAASQEERDSSAQSRIDYWIAAMNMIAEYPLGSGGEAAFMTPRGWEYIKHLNDTFRAVHNGYLDMGASWGVQGLGIFLLAAFLCFMHVVLALRRAVLQKDSAVTLLCALLISLAVSQLVVAIFLSSLDGELPSIALAMCYIVDRCVAIQSEPTQIEGSLI